MEGPAIISSEQIPEKEIKPELSLSEWIFERIRPFVGGRILEIDNGEGKIAPFCRKRGIEIIVTPIESHTTPCENIQIEFDIVIDLHTVYRFASHAQSIIKHTTFLRKEGLFIMQLPFLTALYEGLDTGYKEWKWQNGKLLNQLLNSQFNVLKTRCFIITDNPPLISPQSVKYKEKVTLFNPNQTLGFNQRGLSAIIVCQKI